MTVVQFPFITLTGFFNQKCNRLKARVIIYAYQHHVRLLVRRENRRGEVNARSLEGRAADRMRFGTPALVDWSMLGSA